MRSTLLATVWVLLLMSGDTHAQFKPVPKPMPLPAPLPTPLPYSPPLSGPGLSTPQPSPSPSPGPYIGPAPSMPSPPSAGGRGGCPPNCPEQIPGPWRDALRLAGTVVSVEEQRSRILSAIKPSAWDERARLETLFKLLTTHWLIGNTYGSDLINRQLVVEHAKAELKDLMNQAVAATVDKMRSDVAQLLPYFWNVFASEKRHRLMQLDEDIQVTGEQAKREVNSNFETLRAPDGRSGLLYRPGNAARQLEQIDKTKTWKSQ